MSKSKKFRDSGGFGDETTGFQYDLLPDNIRGDARGTADDIRALHSENYAEIGRRLEEMHKRLEHGAWLPWLKLELGETDQWARDRRAYFRATQEGQPDAEAIQQMLPSIALKVLRLPPGPLREEFLDRARNGGRIYAKEVDQRRKEAKAPAISSEEFDWDKFSEILALFANSDKRERMAALKKADEMLGLHLYTWNDVSNRVKR